MDWKELGSKIAGSAPILGGIIGGPAGSVAGAGIKALAGIFGLSETSTPDEIDKVISVDPNIAMKLKMAEMDFQLQTQKNENDKLKIYIEDVQDARLRERENTKNTGKKDIYLYLLASVIVIGFFTLCAVLMYRPLPAGSNEVVFMLFGTLSAAVGSVIGYFFGTSKSSADKTDIIAKNQK